MNQEHLPPPLDDAEEVFIALAAHDSDTIEQPPTHEELNTFFNHPRQFSKQRQAEILAYLDSSPEAYQRWIQQGKTSRQPSRVTSLFSAAPYAIAACALVLLLSLGLLWRGTPFELEQAIDQSYQATVFHENTDRLRHTTESLLNTLQQAGQSLAFSESAQLSPLGQTFMSGLQNPLQPSVPPSEFTGEVHLREDYQLGRWYALLWSITQQSKGLPDHFWQHQLLIQDHLQTHYSSLPPEISTEQSTAIVLQLERLDPIFKQLAQDPAATQSYRQLEQVLLAMSYSLIPSQ